MRQGEGKEEKKRNEIRERWGCRLLGVGLARSVNDI